MGIDRIGHFCMEMRRGAVSGKLTILSEIYAEATRFPSYVRD